MDWTNERYVKVYVRETVDSVALSWEARAIWSEILTHCDRAGIISLGRSGVRGLAGLIRMPTDVVEEHLGLLVDDGRVRVNGQYLIVPNFIEAQEARQSDKQRQAESRARRRDKCMLVTIRDKSSQNSDTPCDSESQNVTNSHTVSHGVTPSLAQTRLEETRDGEPRAPARDQKQKRSRRKTQLPDDWAPSDSHFELAKDLNLSAAEEAVKFREHAAANGRVMKNWNAAFNMWIRKASEWGTGGGACNQPGSSQAWLRVVNRHLEHKGDVELTPRDKRALTAIGGSWAVKHGDAKGLPFLKKQFCESWEAIGEHSG